MQTWLMPEFFWPLLLIGFSILALLIGALVILWNYAAHDDRRDRGRKSIRPD